ncbi:MAG: galactosyltransferase-related protein [Myxococcota bacterium]|nr:galactosyltransferase-related protein [Myxococcota bacterium]
MTTILFIPYRDRDEHLMVFRRKAVPLLRRHIDDLKIVLVEQAPGKLFNKGKLLNAGFPAYMHTPYLRYIINHDIDIIPDEHAVSNFYTKRGSDVVRIYADHDHCLGGINMFRKEAYIQSNGYPCDIWGWGIEDRALYCRVLMSGLRILNVGRGTKGRFKRLHHSSNAEEYMDEKQRQSDIWKPSSLMQLSKEEIDAFCNRNGINDVAYRVVSQTTIENNFENLIVEL